MPWTANGEYIDDGTSSDNSGNDAYTGVGGYNADSDSYWPTNTTAPTVNGTYNANSDSYWPTNTASTAGQMENVFDPTFGGKYTAVANPTQNTGGILNYLKSMDLTSAGGLAGAALGATGAFTNKPKKAYEGSIPQMQAIRNMVTAPPPTSTGYRPGQGGVNWNADTYYVPKGSVTAGEAGNMATAAAAANAARAANTTAAAKKNSALNNLTKVAGAAGIATLLNNVLTGKTGVDTATGLKTLIDKITGGTKTGTTTTNASNAAKAAAAAATRGLGGTSGGTKGGTSGGTKGGTSGGTGTSDETANADQPVYKTQEEADAANAVAGENDLSMAGEVSPYNEDGTLKEGYDLDEEGNPVFVSSGDTSTTFTPDGSIDNNVDLTGGDTTYDWSGDMSDTDYGNTDYSGFDFGSNDFNLGDYGLDGTDLSNYDFGNDDNFNFGLDDFELAKGGAINMAKGRYLQGNTDGMADKIPARIGQDQPAALSHGEFVVPADVVSHLGNGNSDAGAKKLYQMMDKIRVARTGTKKQGKEINPDKFMPGGLAQAYASGGSVNGFADGGTTGATGLGAAVNAGITGTETGPNSFAGDYIANMLGKTQALSESPYQQYMGPLTAGASGLQNQVFTGLQNTNFPGNLGQSFSSAGAYQTPGMATNAYTPSPIGTGAGAGQLGDGGNTPSAPAQPTGIASQYMNPYLQSVLTPQLQELQRQSQINLQPGLAKLTQAGGFGGGRQAIMESEANRNLLQEQNKTIGQGYANAYDKAQQQFNAEQAQGRSLADLMAQQGAQQRGIEAEGIAADKASFEAARENPYKMLQFQQSMLNGLPISATSYNIAQPTKAQEILAGAAGGAKAVGANNKTVADLLAQLGL
jgi:hypothetical protein